MKFPDGKLTRAPNLIVRAVCRRSPRAVFSNILPVYLFNLTQALRGSCTRNRGRRSGGRAKFTCFIGYPQHLDYYLGRSDFDAVPGVVSWRVEWCRLHLDFRNIFKRGNACRPQTAACAILGVKLVIPEDGTNKRNRAIQNPTPQYVPLIDLESRPSLRCTLGGHATATEYVHN